MLLEWIEYLRTRSNKTAKEWGYTYQNVALKFRSSRCKQAWQSHIDECHQLIREELELVKPKTVMVLGSGLLLEVPIDDLLARVEKIYLVDLVHSAKIRKLAQKHSKIELIERDLSSLLGFLKKGLGAFELKSIPWDKLPDWSLPKVDLVISANLMSQIPLIISESLPMSTSVYNTFARRLRDQHVQRVCAQGERGLLFADFETRYIDRSGKQLKLEDYKVSMIKFEYIKEWLWEISPYGETSKDYKVVMCVRAFRF